MSSASDDETISADAADCDRAHLGELAPGQLFAGRYEIQGLLGRGGMGAVYRVRDRKLDEVVALKLLTLDTEKAVERFQREVRLARRVTHPNVARTHDIGTHGDVHFLTMEYVRGTPLDRVVQDGEKLDPIRVAKIGAQIAAGLASAHAAGVVHRDLKPGNVLIGEDGRVVLTDFGIARAQRNDLRTHETGALVGTPHYMSPEQVVGAEVDGRSDIYALGLILYELATARFPFEAESPLAVAVMRMHQAPVDPRTFEPIPDALAELILRCLAREPDARMGSADEVREALLAISDGRPLTAPPQRPPTFDPRTPTSGVGSLYAPISPGRRALAILPFVYRGDPEHDYLGEGLAEELIDTLSRTKGLRVLAIGATKRFAEDRDPGRIGIELSADAIVDGTVQVSRDRVRISARLVETDSGVQRWSERYDGSFQDVFALQETMGRRVAESLRLEIDAAAHRQTAPQEAIELYLRARREMRGDIAEGDGVIEKLERCLELAPTFTPALPVLAMAGVRAWWANQSTRGKEAGDRARAWADRAMRDAPDIAETHLVRAMIASQDGDSATAAQAYAKTIEIAPTMPEAHCLLGELQIETGRMKEGKRRVELALELDPTLHRVYLALARVAALEGDFDRYDVHMRKLDELSHGPSMALSTAQFRFALWRRDIDGARRIAAALAKVPGDGPRAFLALANVAIGDAKAEDVMQLLATVPNWIGNARFAALTRQLSTEIFAFAGARDIALEVLTELADGILVDVEWMRRCPMLEPLRDSPVYAEALDKVERRAASVWKR